MHLVPCPECERHVRNLDAACPFCGSSVPESLRAHAPVLPRKRLGRSALASFRAIGAASVIALAAAGCGGSDGAAESDTTADTAGSGGGDTADETAAGGDEGMDLEESHGFAPAGDEGDTEGEAGLQPAYGTPP